MVVQEAEKEAVKGAGGVLTRSVRGRRGWGAGWGWGAVTYNLCHQIIGQRALHRFMYFGTNVLYYLSNTAL